MNSYNPLMPDHIEFGTDGWRAVIAEAFTFANVRRVARAIAVAAKRLEPPDTVDRDTLAVGWDRRFLSREFAEAVAEQLQRSGYRVLLSDAATPSQTISHAALRRNILGGVMVTASHNPARYNGLKFKAWYGGSAVPSIYQMIADAIDREAPAREGGSVETADFLSDYVSDLRGHLDLDQLRQSPLRILHDPIHGVAAGLPERILADTAEVVTIRGEENPSFGGVHPEPIPQNLAASMEAMRGAGYDLAICNDGDADRLGVLDESGNFVTPHQILSLLTLDLVRRKGADGEIVKTFSTTRVIERIAASLGVPLHETGIGFKYVADLMLERRILIGGEESGGVGFGDFLPERDGILSGLRVAECIAANRKPLSELVGAMEKEFGASRFGRRDIRAPMDRCVSLIEDVRGGVHDELFGHELERREEKDGCKLSYTDGTWILFRRSGTEPLIRIYCESTDQERVDENLTRAAGLLE
jgi:phosphomannomutase